MAESPDERAQRLRERLNREYPPRWEPQEGDVLEGTVVRIEPAPTRFGKAIVVEIVDAGGHGHSVWLLHTVLRNEFHRQRVLVGEFVVLRYDGTRRPDGRDPYEAYSVVVDRPDPPPFDWDAELGRIERDDDPVHTVNESAAVSDAGVPDEYGDVPFG